jgi:vesicle coat complex subunit
LKNELNSDRPSTRKEAVKKVIANMTVGKDVSGLFADVLKCIQTEDLELKKLVYLYLMNYAKTQPELVILAVNTFCKDTEDRNPLIRALAIRTMGCLRVDKIIDYLCEPLRKCLTDDNPYVRKTAALCTAKLFDIAPELAEENGLIGLVQDMLGDSNPMVVANAVASLVEISESNPRVFQVNSSILTKLVNALNDCTEWGQICILDVLAEYVPADHAEAELIVEKCLPRLQHANGAVVLSTVKVMLIYLDKYIKNEEMIKQVAKKMAPPLVTLTSSIPEVQYVAYRNLHLILQLRPNVLGDELRAFFCKYNDPLYVKIEKLDIIVRLCNDNNIDQVLNELKEYANEVDVEFVRKSIKAIGRCAVKVDNSAEKCLNCLLELIKTKINYVVQESIVVIKDVFRKYPTGFEGIIPLLCENLETLDESESRSSLIWIIGEYADKIENAHEILNYFIESFEDDTHQVRKFIESYEGSIANIDRQC